MKRILRFAAVLMAVLLSLAPAALAEGEAEETALETGSTGFDVLGLWPWQSLTVRVRGAEERGLMLDVLAPVDEERPSWQGVNHARLAEEGLTEADIAPMLSAVPEGWGGLLSSVHARGRTEGTLTGTEEERIFRRNIPKTVRLALYDPASGTVTVTEPFRLRQYQSLVEVDAVTGRVTVMTGVSAGIWLWKLLLRTLVSAGITVLACMVIFDTNRLPLLLIKLASGALYFLLMVIFPGGFEKLYLLKMILVTLAMTVGEGWLVYFFLTPRSEKPALLYTAVSAGTSLLLALWWLC